MLNEPKPDTFTLSTTGPGLGDTLLFTSPFRHSNAKHKIINLTPSIERFSFFFENLVTKINITDNIEPTTDIGHGHFAARKCRHAGYEGTDIIPQIIFDSTPYDNEVISVLKNIETPVVLKLECSNTWKHLRQFPLEYWLNYLKIPPHNIIQFGVSDSFIPFPGAIHMVDVPLKLQTAYFRHIKRYIGVDTGDLHLMLAVGGCVEVHVPPSNIYYKYDEWHYNSERAKYVVV
jgi:hypothetical protein